MAVTMRSAYRWMVQAGFDPRATGRFFREIVPFRRELAELRRQSYDPAETFAIEASYPVLGERDDASGTARGHYFHQDLLVARRVFEAAPLRHLDVGSRIDGFVAHVAAFRPIEVIDIRPQPASIPNVTFLQADMMAPLPGGLPGSCDSLSCLHALEHFGLGRYGDPVRHDGHLIGLSNLVEILAPRGTLYLSVPIGPQRIEFNAHRVFSVRYLLEHLEPRFSVTRFSFVDDRGDLHEDVDLARGDVSVEFGCWFGCGIFEMTRS